MKGSADLCSNALLLILEICDICMHPLVKRTGAADVRVTVT